MRYFKVVRVKKQKWNRPKQKLVSVSPCIGGELEYFRKKFTKMIPGSLGIFVFSSAETARQFARGSSRWDEPCRVYSCAVKGAAVQMRWIQLIHKTLDSLMGLSLFGGRTRKKRAESLGHIKWDGRCGPRVVRAPANSYTVTAVRLKRHIYTS
jgi:hypothetical protein